ncbi:MAG: polyprenyl synthetase family protein [Clostridiaceae bacterium]|nr:polyprenyl synthetase family protein [Clostridiaceae bacterium]
MQNFKTTYQEHLELIENKLLEITSEENFIQPFSAAKSLKYSLLSGGKRIRPVLVFAVVNCFNLKITDELIHLAVCIEMIHNYSLIHDDLPAMDDDSLRRGKPTNHMVYGEGMAILGGDALLNLAYENLFEIAINNPKTLKIAKRISYEAGINGMIGGQSMDLEGSEFILTNNSSIEDKLAYLKKLQELKTGGLIRAAVLTGYHYSEINNQNIDFNSKLEYLFEDYANKLGLAFQIRDDLLDVLSNEDTLGKSIGKDSRDNKLTFVSLLGIDEAKDFEKKLYQEIEEIFLELKKYNLNIKFLKNLTEYLTNRAY